MQQNKKIVNGLEVMKSEHRLSHRLGNVVGEQFHDCEHGKTAILQLFCELLNFLVAF